MEFDQTEPAY